MLAADHGESLGQHGEPTHAVLTYDSTLHVALIIKPAERVGIVPGVVDDPVAHVDIVPTVCEMLGIDPPAPVHGHSLVPQLRGEPRPENPSYFECALPFFSYRWEHLYGVRRGQWKYIHGPQRELYNLSLDPDEVYNLAASHEDRRLEMEGLLFGIVESTRTPDDFVTSIGALDTDTMDKLRALGYVGSAAAPSKNDGINPRRPTGRMSPNTGATLLQDYYAALSLSSAGKLGAAAEIYERVLCQLDPGNPGFLVDLAELKRKLGDFDRAYALYRRALALNPEDVEVLSSLAQLEIDRGHDTEAEQLLESAMAIDPQQLHAAFLSARLAALRGDGATAMRRYLQVLEIDPSHRDTLINVGILHAKVGAFDLARERFQEALRVAPFSPRAQYNFGLLELHAERTEDALRHFETALRFRNPYPEAQLALAMTLLEIGDVDRARTELQSVVDMSPTSTAAGQARSLLGEPTLNHGAVGPTSRTQ